MRYVHVQQTQVEDAWVAGQQRAAKRRLVAVLHHQLFFVGMRTAQKTDAPAPGSTEGRTAWVSATTASRPGLAYGLRLAAASTVRAVPRDFGRLDLADADLASPWPAWAKDLAHRFAEARGSMTRWTCWRC
ncbi:hypothetical protein AB0D66_32655 [Streptomyces sp. NPDC048270]|uniref:hypothetical protein n=1 Tax=Streptomyces sp. NPDC048270 TaxID=3154615 RepID=UPI00340C1EBA